jgi:hypothetical protein
MQEVLWLCYHSCGVDGFEVGRDSWMRWRGEGVPDVEEEVGDG